jgi:hypothetical protein
VVPPAYVPPILPASKYERQAAKVAWGSAKGCRT